MAWSAPSIHRDFPTESWTDRRVRDRKSSTQLGIPELHAILFAEMEEDSELAQAACETVPVRGHDRAHFVVPDRAQHCCVPRQMRHSHPGAKIRQPNCGDAAEPGDKQICTGDLLVKQNGWLDVRVANSAAVIRQEPFGGDLAVRLRRD